MKKSSVVNLTIVCCLLTLCITTLIVIYATAPETSVILFEENFNTLDESKWTHESAECKEGGESLYYTDANDEDRQVKSPPVGDTFSADGTLHFFEARAEKTKRETQSECDSCINWENGAVDCFSSKYSARLRTKTAFHVNCGQIEVRSRLPRDHLIKLTISIVPVKNETGAEAWGGFVVRKTDEEMGRNCSADIQVFLGPGANESVIESGITDNDFHLYKIEWDDSKIFFSLDGRTLLENVFPGQNVSCSKKRGTVAIDQPFHITIGVDIGGSNPMCRRDHSDRKRSLTLFDSSILDVDYIRFNKILI